MLIFQIATGIVLGFLIIDYIRKNGANLYTIKGLKKIALFIIPYLCIYGAVEWYNNIHWYSKQIYIDKDNLYFIPQYAIAFILLSKISYKKIAQATKSFIQRQFSAKCNRMTYFGALFFVGASIGISQTLYRQYDLSPLIPLLTLAVCLPIFVVAIIQRANSFINTPWFFGGLFIIAWLGLEVDAILAFNEMTPENSDVAYAIHKFFFYPRIGWFIANLFLLFTPAKQPEKSANLS